MSSSIKSSLQYHPSKVKIIDVPATLKASVTAHLPKEYVVVERDSRKGFCQTGGKHKVRPIKVPGCPLPQVIPGHIEPIPIERKEICQDKENLKENKLFSGSKLVKQKRVTQDKVTKDGILTLKGIITDYQKVYNPKIYLPSNYHNRKTLQDNNQRDIYEYPHSSNCLALENLLTPREYSFSPSISPDSEDITTTNTFDEPITFTNTFQKPTREREISSRACKRIISDVSDSESELISMNNFSHNASEKQKNMLYDNIMSNKIQKNKDYSRTSGITTGDGITLLLSQSMKSASQSSVKKVVTFSDPPEMPNVLDEANNGIVPVKQGYIRVRERPHISILGDKNRNKKINSHAYKNILNPNSRLTQNKPSGEVCNRAVKLGLFENKQGIPKSKASSHRYNSSQKNSAEEKKNKTLQKEIETKKLSNSTTKCEEKPMNLGFVNENLTYLLNLKKTSSNIDEREPREVEASELEKAIFLASEIRGKLQEHSSDTLSDLSTLISDLRTGRFDEDKYIISKRVDKCIRKTYEQAINEVREGRILSPVPTWSENRRAIWKDDNFESLSPTQALSTHTSASMSHYPSSARKLQDNVPPLFYSPKRYRKIKIDKEDHKDKNNGYDISKRVSKREKNMMRNMVDKPITSNSEPKRTQEFPEENKSNKYFEDTYTVRPTFLQRSIQVKLNIPANRVVQKLPGVSISPKDHTGSRVTDRNKVFNIKHNDTYSETSDLEERDQNKNHCPHCFTSGILLCNCNGNIEDVEVTNEPKPKNQARKTLTLQDQNMKYKEDIKKMENSDFIINEENKEDNVTFNHLTNTNDEVDNCKKKSLGMPKSNVEDNELPGYFPSVRWEEVEIPDPPPVAGPDPPPVVGPEVRWEEVHIPDPPPVEGSYEEVAELEHKLQQYQLQQRLLNRLEDGLRQFLIREVQVNSQEEDISSPAEPIKRDAGVMHNDRIKEDQTLLATRSVLEKLVREQLTLRREQRQQRVVDNQVSLHGEDGTIDEDFVSTDGSTVTSYTTPESPSKVSSHSTSMHSLEGKVCSPLISPSASPKRPGSPPYPILTPDPSLDIQNTAANSFTSISSPSPPTPSLPKTRITNLPDAPGHTPHLSANPSPTLESRSHSPCVPSRHQSQPHSPYLTPFESPHPTAQSSPSHPSKKLSASDLRSSSSGSSHSHTGELLVQSHDEVDTSPGTPCIQPNSDIIQDLTRRQSTLSESQLRDMLTTLFKDSQEQDIPQPPPPTPAPQVTDISTTHSMDFKVKGVTQTPSSTPIPQVPDISTTLPMVSKVKDVTRTPPPTPVPQVPEIATTLPMDLSKDQIKDKDNDLASDEDIDIEPYRETWTQDGDQVSRVSDSRETWSPLTPAVACYSSGNATFTSTEASNKTWVTMSEGEILPGLVNTSLFEEGEVMYHKSQKQRSEDRSISLKHKKVVNRSISCESVVLLESISEGLFVEDLAEDTIAEESLIEDVLIAALSISSKGLSLEDLLEESLAEEGVTHGLHTNNPSSEGAYMNSFCISEGMLIAEDNSGAGSFVDESKTNVTSIDAEGCESIVQEDSSYSLGQAKHFLQDHKLQQDKAESMSKLYQENPELMQLQQENAALLARFENFQKFAFLSKSSKVGSARSRISK